jgi:serine/threonine-protein kinase
MELKKGAIGKGKKIRLTLGMDFIVMNELYPMNDRTGRALFHVVERHSGLDYALKVFHLEINDMGSIRKEALALNRQLPQADFPRFRFYHEAQGLGFMFLDWVPGETLRQVYGDKPPADKEEYRLRLNAFIALCGKVEQVHRIRQIHRDLKPDNVLLPDRRKPEEVRVIDFGLAAISRSAQEGTPGYCAPEQVYRRDFNLNHLTDVYGLGQIGWWLLTGHTFDAGVDDDNADWDKDDFPEFVAPDFVSGKAKTALLKALAFDPKCRHHNVGKLKHAFIAIRQRG